ncbi:hypothetical protein MATL_G00113680 [Megalops atlanticus]|uniref:MBD domain-containing protein n=1 Tax=Megalops atlanticus TaxID=7932 RepID=A0A9D3TE91_MEGAT|nr:hypothetical protein MATL_G00113680 [Megalops atlanticus]
MPKTHKKSEAKNRAHDRQRKNEESYGFHARLVLEAQGYKTMIGGKAGSADKDGFPLPAAQVPIGWQRKVKGGAVVYVSPSGMVLSSVEEVRAYLLADGTCKCGLECPLLVHKVFCFDPRAAVLGRGQLPWKAEQDMTKLCNHRRKAVAMAALCRSMQVSQVAFAGCRPGAATGGATESRDEGAGHSKGQETKEHHPYSPGLCLSVAWIAPTPASAHVRPPPLASAGAAPCPPGSRSSPLPLTTLGAVRGSVLPCSSSGVVEGMLQQLKHNSSNSTEPSSNDQSTSCAPLPLDPDRKNGPAGAGSGPALGPGGAGTIELRAVPLGQLLKQQQQHEASFPASSFLSAAARAQRASQNQAQSGQIQAQSGQIQAHSRPSGTDTQQNQQQNRPQTSHLSITRPDALPGSSQEQKPSPQPAAHPPTAPPLSALLHMLSVQSAQAAQAGPDPAPITSHLGQGHTQPSSPGLLIGQPAQCQTQPFPHPPAANLSPQTRHPEPTEEGPPPSSTPLGVGDSGKSEATPSSPSHSQSHTLHHTTPTDVTLPGPQDISDRVLEGGPDGPGDAVHQNLGAEGSGPAVGPQGSSETTPTGVHAPGTLGDAPAPPGDAPGPLQLAESFPFMSQEQLLQLLSGPSGLPSLLAPPFLGSLPMGVWVGGQQGQAPAQTPPPQQNAGLLSLGSPPVLGTQGDLPVNFLGLLNATPSAAAADSALDLNPNPAPEPGPAPEPACSPGLEAGERPGLQALLLASLLLGQQQPASLLPPLGSLSFDLPLQQPFPSFLEGGAVEKPPGLADSLLSGPGLPEALQGQVHSQVTLGSSSAADVADPPQPSPGQGKSGPLPPHLLPPILTPGVLGDLAALSNIGGLLGTGPLLLPPMQGPGLSAPLIPGQGSAINPVTCLLNNIQLNLCPALPVGEEKPIITPEKESPTPQEEVPANHLGQERAPSPGQAAGSGSVLDPYASFMDTIYTSFLQVSSEQAADTMSTRSALPPSQPREHPAAPPTAPSGAPPTAPPSTAPMAPPGAPPSLSPQCACSLRNPEVSHLSTDSAQSPACGTPKPSTDGSSTPPLSQPGDPAPTPAFLEEAKTNCSAHCASSIGLPIGGAEGRGGRCGPPRRPTAPAIRTAGVPRSRDPRNGAGEQVGRRQVPGEEGRGDWASGGCWLTSRIWAPELRSPERQWR